jgi:hypothetical protein
MADEKCMTTRFTSDSLNETHYLKNTDVKIWYCYNVCLFSWRYNPLWLYFHSPVAGFSLLVFEVATVSRTPLDE